MKSTAFARVFAPREMVDYHSMQGIRVTSRQLEQTIRAFLNAGEDFEHAYDDHYIRALIQEENSNLIDDIDHLRPSSWLLEEVMPAINPSILNWAFWDRCLRDSISRGHTRLPCTNFIMAQCRVESIRCTLLTLLRNLAEMYSPPPDTTDNILLLLEASGGLLFVDPYWEETPVSQAIKYPRSFSALRTALRTANYDLTNVVRQEIEFRSNGWIETRLLALFHDVFELKPVSVGKPCGCRVCKLDMTDPREDQLIEWKRRVRRYKEGFDHNSPFNEAEVQEMMLVEDARKAYDKGICWRCHGAPC